MQVEEDWIFKNIHNMDDLGVKHLEKVFMWIFQKYLIVGKLVLLVGV